jgi:hypothetical protein
MSGDKIRNISLDVVDTSGFAAPVGLGADNFHLHGLAYVLFRKKAARVDAAQSRSAICV